LPLESCDSIRLSFMSGYIVYRTDSFKLRDLYHIVRESSMPYSRYHRRLTVISENSYISGLGLLISHEISSFEKRIIKRLL